MRFLSETLAAWRKKFEGPLPRYKITAYLIGEDYMRGSDGVPHHSWPYRLHYTPGHRGDFHFYEGDVRNGFGGFLSAHEALEISGISNLKKANAEWLIPLLERMASGQAVAAEEIFAAYKEAHGRRPRREEWQMFTGLGR